MRRFWDKVDKNGPIPESYPDLGNCWIWKAAIKTTDIEHQKYGVFGIGKKTVRAHRFSWTLHFGEIPKGMFVLHRCDNSSCVNPDHLFLGTQKENLHDMQRKGRKPCGESAPWSKLTEFMVRSIRADKRRQRAIASAFGICQQTVSDIKRGIIWKGCQ
jgi:hypothetical protein